jgi:hypothetical protein
MKQQRKMLDITYWPTSWISIVSAAGSVYNGDITHLAGN